MQILFRTRVLEPSLAIVSGLWALIVAEMIR
jgi:hypothetical protein